MDRDARAHGARCAAWARQELRSIRTGDGNAPRGPACRSVREDPYGVTVDFRVPEGAAREAIVAAIRKEPILAARLLADDMPTEIESIFRAAGFDLFPGGKLAPGKYDMTTACSCPDYANPCKHVAAVLLVLGEEIARRPLTLLELRGVGEEELYEE